jgi:glycosyltransferase involved in cell wall biosynthesis
MVDIIYDLSRLSTRALNVTPNGIDWIDTFWADYFVSRSSRPADTLLFGFRGPRLFPPGAIEIPTKMLDKAWGRDEKPTMDAIPKSLLTALLGTGRASAIARVSGQRQGARLHQAIRIGASLAKYGLRLGSDPASHAPRGAIYINASHYPLEQSRHVAWLEARPDVRPVFFIHDLLPVAKPNLFWSAEPARHARRLELLARRGAAAVVASEAVEVMLRDHMRCLGRPELPIHRANPPVLSMFDQPIETNERLAAARYFVVCGTIEPRKNHLLLVEVWRHLVAEMGDKAPRLLIVGKRGWRCDQIVQAIADPKLRSFVIEANGLSTAAYRVLLGHALALLSPSTNEGYGLPLAEALASGVPAVASDIPSHREQGRGAVLYLPPDRPEDWHHAVTAVAAPESRLRADLLARARLHVSVKQSDYEGALSAFLNEIT